MTEKKWLLLCQRHIKIQQAAESISGQRPVSSLCPSALGPSKVAVGVSPQKAFGCQRQAKRSACPTRGWVKPASPDRVLTVPVLSALQGGFGVILLTFASSVHPLILASRQPWRLRYNVLTLRLWCGRRTTPSASSSPHTAAHRPSRAGLGYRRLLTCRDV